MVFLEGEHIHLRAMEPNDLEDLYVWENDPDNWFVSQTRVPYSKHSLKQFIEDSQKDIYEIRQMRFIIALNSEEENKRIAIGAIDLFDFDPYHRRSGVGILIARKEYRRQGIAFEALTLLIHYSFQILGLHQLFCNVAKGNDASFNLFIKCGFQVTGEKKDWLRETESWTNEYLLQLINLQD